MSTPTSTGWNLELTYTKLPEIFYSRLSPTAVHAPEPVILNETLARELGLNPDKLRTEYTQTLSGNAVPEGSSPIAEAYAGHQFGGFTILGDGRALLLGEQVAPDGKRWDIHLKGSGPTPYSRRGDGRAALAPMLREYLISEAMHALNVPTTRSLAVVATGEPVFRETTLPGAVLTRVAASHIRVGTFEFAARQSADVVKALADYAIARHYPELKDSTEPYRAFFRAVIRKQCQLVAKWMGLGFIHGVMNTDNVLVSGETIDYGPCAFMDRYDPATVFSSIDSRGRYAYQNQPAITHWNLTRFVETLLPLFDESSDVAITKAKEDLETFSNEFADAWLAVMRAKLGLTTQGEQDAPLITDLLDLLHAHKLDWTNSFRTLAIGQSLITESDPKAWDAWKERYTERLTSEPSLEASSALMLRSNPNVIPRNHQVEEALTAATRGDLSLFTRLLSAVQKPFQTSPEHLPYLQPAPIDAEPYQTFCGT